MIVMHPLPRLECFSMYGQEHVIYNLVVLLCRLSEISPEIDGDHRAAYFRLTQIILKLASHELNNITAHIRQMEYGMFMRMAILDTLLSKRTARLG